MKSTGLSTPVGFLFDLDGVLIDSEKEYTLIWHEINRRFNSGYDDLEYRIKGMTLDNIIATYFPEPSMKEKITAALYELEEKMKYEWIPGSREFLALLRDKKLPAALITSSNDVKMKHLRDEIPDAESFFDVIVTSDKVTHSKPHPEGYLLAASLLAADPRNCVVFEDSLQGVKAGRNSGAFVVGMTGTLPAETIAPYADIVVNRLSEINPDDITEILTNR